ncbi:MAG: lysylphosphatidylglycerol synthase transmembrane domain-containing protein [Byssovorax sp.]
MAIAMALNIVQLGAKSERWRTMLSAGSPARLPPLRVYHYLVTAYGASMVLPGPVGEALRIYLLRRRHGISIGLGTAVAVLEKLFDGLGLILILAPLPFLLTLPRPAALTLGALCLAGLAVVLLVVLVARRAPADVFAGRLARLAHLAPGLESFRRPAIFLRASALSLGAHLLDAVTILLLMRAVGLDLPWISASLVILALRLAMIVPLTPGHVGTLEASITAALALLGTRPEQAVAFALVYHALQLFPVLVLAASGTTLVTEARAAYTTR